MNLKIKNWLLVVLWASFIFFISHQPGLKSNLPANWDFFLRKIAHITEYAILTYLLIRSLSQYKISRKKVIWLAIILAVLYAVSDEYHQTFILNREGTIKDVLIDSLGIISIGLVKRKMVK